MEHLNRPSPPDKNDILDAFKKTISDPKDYEDVLGFLKTIKKGVSLDDYDLDDLREKIDKIRKVVPPVISVPKKFIAEIKQKGYIESHPTWTGHKMLCATVGRSPYNHNNEERLFFIVKPHIPIEPRFTGKDRLFKGVVIIEKDRLDLNNDLQQLN